MGAFSWVNGGQQRQTMPGQHELDVAWAQAGNALPGQFGSREMVGARMQPQDEQHPRPPSSQSRSRTNTMTSSVSFYATSSTSDESAPDSSRPSSQFVRTAIGPQQHADKKDSATKTFFSKGGRMLRRQGSKFNLMSLQGLESSSSTSTGVGGENGHVDVLNKQHVRKGSAADKRDVLKRTISEPFGFQHVTHTNRNHFGDFDRVHKNELLSEFSAIRAGQQAKGEIRGIPVDDLPSNKSSPTHSHIDPPASPTATLVPALPLTPPRPLPPPKDLTFSPSGPAVDIRLSRSLENFSRPVPRSPVSPITPVLRSPARLLESTSSPLATSVVLEQLATADELVNTTSDLQQHSRSLSSQKPLPCLPDIIHAVSTNDDVARPLRTAPLPKIPAELADVPEEDEGGDANAGEKRAAQPTQQPSLRHVNSFPVPRDFPPRGSSFGPALQHKSVLIGKTTPFSFPITLQPTVPAENMVEEGDSRKSKRISIGLKTIEVNDWEDAIDYSWDHASEAEYSLDSAQANRHSSQVKSPPSKLEVPLSHRQELMSPTITPYENEQESSSEAEMETETVTDDVSTPDMGLMLNVCKNSKASHSTTTESRLDLSHGKSSPVLLGLGIESSSFVDSDDNHLWGEEMAKRSYSKVASNLHHSAGSGISKSSSQESMTILSIASSIIGTQRSSHSSASMTDLSPSISSIKELEHSKQDTSDSNDEFASATEDIIAEYTRKPTSKVRKDVVLINQSHRSYPSYPSMLPRKPASHRRAQSLVNEYNDESYLSSAAKPTAVTSSEQALPSPMRQKSGNGRVNSVSRIPTPTRTTSIVSETKQRPNRSQRSATVSSMSTSPSAHTRNAPRAPHASYSMFPSSTPPLPLMTST